MNKVDKVLAKMAVKTAVETIALLGIAAGAIFLMTENNPPDDFVPPTSKIEELAYKIIDPSVSGLELEQQGFFNFDKGGYHLKACRAALTAFDKTLSAEGQAQKISGCITTKSGHIQRFSFGKST